MLDQMNGIAEPELATLAAFAEARRMQGPLRRAAAFSILLALAIPAALLLPTPLRATPIARALLPSGIPALLTGALLLAATGLAATLGIVRARIRTLHPPLPGPVPPRILRRLRLARPGVSREPRAGVSRAARWPQALTVAAGAALALLAMVRLWPAVAPPPLPAELWFAIGGACLVLAFPLLVGERVFAATDPLVLPEAPGLRVLLLLPVLACVLAALAALATGLGIRAAPRLVVAALAYLIAVAAELALRGFGRCFLPPPDPERARAAVGSWLAALLHPANASPSAIAATMRERFGIDFARSWALGFMRRALPPVLLLMLLIGWMLTGVTEIDVNQRGSYERMGAPVAMLQPGLHVLLPWPFGRARRVEYGVVHAIDVGYGVADPAKAPPPDRSTAEEPAPASANRLWDQAQDSDVSYIIASETGGHQSFETVSVNLRVLYRIGMSDGAARDALYRSGSPEDLVRTASGRLLAHFFAARTLADALGENRQSIANGLRADLQHALDGLSSGVEIVAVIVEAMHPPGGAAVAYRAVQAAEIAARTSIAEERGRAATTASLARRDTAETIARADADAASAISAAEIDLRTMDADSAAYRAGGRAFLLERYFADLRPALAQSALEIIDHRLDRGDAPVIDLRPPGSPGAPGAGENTP
jgi:regulator of protease activity HflC (stomatin/prohibitin superfamily)